MLVTLLIAPINAAHKTGEYARFRANNDLAPEDSTMTVSPFDIVAITPVEYFPEIYRQCPNARSVVTCETAQVMGNVHMPVLTPPTQMNDIWNRAIREYSAVAHERKCEPNPMLIDNLEKQGLIHPPKWLGANTQFLCMMGSVAYAVSSDTSDIDVYGFTIPYKNMVFPHLDGEIPDFGIQKQRFGVWQEHHVKTQDGKKEYDFSVYSIVKFFHLCMENNPNMIDCLFVPQRCIVHCTRLGQMVRDARKMFLHKGSYHKFRGYSFAQMSKIRSKSNASNPKRAEAIEQWGYDVKFAYHVVRLALESEQILIEHDLDLEKNSEVLKSIRRGEWKLEDIEQWFTDKMRVLETLYATSTLPHGPDEEAIKTLLLQCLEQHYGSLAAAIQRPDDTTRLMADIEAVIARYR